MKRKLPKAYSYRGANTGRRNNIPEDIHTAGKLHLERLKWVDGDYDYGGAYWGGLPSCQIVSERDYCCAEHCKEHRRMSNA